jgi:hypothetical protein
MLTLAAYRATTRPKVCIQFDWNPKMCYCIGNLFLDTRINLFCRFVGAVCEVRRSIRYPDSMRILVVVHRTTLNQFLWLLFNALRVSDYVSVHSEFRFILYKPSPPHTLCLSLQCLCYHSMLLRFDKHLNLSICSGNMHWWHFEHTELEVASVLNYRTDRIE